MTTQNMSNAIRFLCADAIEKSNSGHPGMPLGMADVATVLFRDVLSFNPKDPKWFNRDRFVLSAGHGSMLLYALFYLTGYEDCTLDEIKNFRQWGAKTAGHPEYGHLEGIETTTGPLGQGLANAVGMALAERILNAEYGDIVNHHTYTIVGDGCLMEGISHEAASFAGHYKLNKLIVLFDDNGISIDGPTSLTVSDNQLQRFAAYGWNTLQIDGHDEQQIKAALEQAKCSDKPTLIACKTSIAKGAKSKENSSSAHGSPLGKTVVEQMRSDLRWTHEPFVVPAETLTAWRAAWLRNKEAYETSTVKLANLAECDKNRILGDFNFDVEAILRPLKQKYLSEKPTLATRQLSQDVLECVTAQLPFMVGGSADLTPSNNTKTKTQQSVTPDNYAGQYIHYGVREHAMAAMMNGMSLHGGFIPYGGTFLVFVDYLKPALRLSSLMEQGVIYVMTHDSIGLGEDGPTHQPIEHLAMLRAQPNLCVLRPCDGIEVVEAYEIALKQRKTPTVLALSRQALPTLRTHTDENLTVRGAYVLHETKDADVTLLASGSEVSLAMAVAEVLKLQGKGARVVSMPSFDLFRKQSKDYQQSVLGNTLRVGIEAASSFGWHEWLREGDLCITMESFGASAPAKDLFKNFGFDVHQIIERIEKKL